MANKKAMLATDEFYHIFNKTVAGEIAFTS